MINNEKNMQFSWGTNILQIFPFNTHKREEKIDSFLAQHLQTFDLKFSFPFPFPFLFIHFIIFQIYFATHISLCRRSIRQQEAKTYSKSNYLSISFSIQPRIDYYYYICSRMENEFFVLFFNFILTTIMRLRNKKRSNRMFLLSVHTQTQTCSQGKNQILK